MNEKVLKSIGFPLSMLSVIDRHAEHNKISRSDVVRQAVEEFITRHKLNKDTNNI